MRILRLKVQNVKGVRSVEIIPDKWMVEVAGANEAGKSSLLDAIMFTLAGKRAIDQRPLRAGAARGESVVETEKFIATRTWRENGDSKLTITPKDGGKWGQRELDEIFGEFSFDPLAFSRMKPADQVDVLRKLAGPEFCERLAAIDAELSEAEIARRDARRDLDRIGAIVPVEPVEPVDVAAIAAELDAVEAHNREQTWRATQRSELARRVAEAKAEIDRAVARHVAILQALEAVAEPEPQRDAAPLRAQLTAAGETNRRAQEYRETLRRVEERADRARAVNDLDAVVKRLREARAAHAGSAKLPIEGAEFDETGLRIGGIPFAQLASSRKIRVSALLGMAANTELRVMRIADGSLLDDASYAEVASVAQEHDHQVWIETVGKGHGDAIVIEAGEVKP